MKIGYVSLAQGVQNAKFKTCTLKNASEENLLNLIENNLNALSAIIDYNIENDIKMFRIISDIIPFGSSPINTILWWDIFKEQLDMIGEKINRANIRVSMHPGQYTVINSPKDDVVDRAILDLEYHTRFLDSLNVDKKHKIILHIGGVYNEKAKAMQRFIDNYKLLSSAVKNRLIIENDDVSYNIAEVLAIGNFANIPVVYDNLHNAILNADPSKSDNYWINKAEKTWKLEDGPQKIHYSQQNENKREGAHSLTVFLPVFMEFVKGIDNQQLYIMLEVKDKNMSAIKLSNALFNSEIKYLEKDWAKYKYTILEKSPQVYNEIRQLLKDKTAYPVFEFYELVESVLFANENIGYTVNALQHVWGYFKKVASDKEKAQYEKLIKAYTSGEKRKELVKNFLERLAIKYEVDYLLDSYYFAID